MEEDDTIKGEKSKENEKLKGKRDTRNKTDKSGRLKEVDPDEVTKNKVEMMDLKIVHTF